MFSVRQKREIADRVQTLLRDTGHPELPDSEIKFCLHVDGEGNWSWADIRNNGAILFPGINRHNEQQDDTRPLTEQDMPTTYPADEPKVDPFGCLEDHVHVMCDAMNVTTDHGDGMKANYAALRLIAALREERRVMLALCKRLQRNVEPVEIDPLVATCQHGLEKTAEALATPSDGKKGRAT